MPNWCYNYLDISGDEALIADIKRQLNKPFVQTHDSWNRTTGKMELSDTEYSNPVFAFHNIYNHTQDGVSKEVYLKQPPHTNRGDSQDTDKIIADIANEMESSNDWYNWNVRNWGTKWDVAVADKEEWPETELHDESKTSLGYKFNTAWSPPIEAITKLAEQYPSLNFNLSYEEETGWGGEYIFENGVGNEIESYENKCRDCDALNTMEYCDNDCGEICSECHYLGEADMDCVAECDIHKEFMEA